MRQGGLRHGRWECRYQKFAICIGIDTSLILDEKFVFIIHSSGVSSNFFTDVNERPTPNLKDTYFTNESREGQYTLKFDFVYQMQKNFELNFGASIKSVQFKYEIWDEVDTLFVYDYMGSNPDALTDTFKIYPELQIDRTFS